MTEQAVVTDSGQPAAPAPVADSAPSAVPAAPESVAPASEPAAAASVDATPAAPSAPAGDSAPRAASPADQRVANAQRMMHAATAARSALEKQLRDLGVVPATQHGQPVSPTGQPAVQAPPPRPAPATPQAPQAQPRQPLTLTPEQRQKIHAAYTGASSDEEATGILVQEVANILLQQIPSVDSIVGDQAFMDRIYGTFNGRIRAETQANERANATIKSINDFFAKHAPGVPEALIWHFADEAVQAKPGDLTEQALYMLERALKEVSPLMGQASTTAQTTNALAQGQGAVLPGGSGLPAAGGGEGQPLSLVEQLKRANQGI